MDERQTYEPSSATSKKQSRACALNLRKLPPTSEQHFVMDAQKMTFAYTGDNRITLERLFR